MKKNRASRRRSVIEASGILIFTVIFALIIQIAVLIFDAIRDKGAGAISVIMLVVIFALALIAATIDTVRRKITIDRPVARILDATDKIASGDFSARIDVSTRYGRYSKYDLISENINKMATELAKNEMISSDFISGVSHEMKTPLAVIKNYTKALAKGGLDEQTKENYVNTIAVATEKLNTLITNVLKLTKLENSEIILDEKEIVLCDYLADTVIRFSEKAEEKGIELNCDFDEFKVFADGGLIELILSNLLSNAIKFTPSGGNITVKIKEEKGRALISVKDSGVGISKEVGARIFDKFYQVDASRKQEGNGLGLALVKKAIDVAGGKIKVSSEPLKGSEFSVTIGKIID